MIRFLGLSATLFVALFAPQTAQAGAQPSRQHGAAIQLSRKSGGNSAGEM